VADHGKDRASDHAGRRRASALVREKIHSTDAAAPVKRNEARAGAPMSPLFRTNSHPMPIVSRPTPSPATRCAPRARDAIRQDRKVPAVRQGRRTFVVRIGPATQSLAVRRAAESAMYQSLPRRAEAPAANASGITNDRRSTGRLIIAPAVRTNIQRTKGTATAVPCL
jgi:hypothetical protein